MKRKKAFAIGSAAVVLAAAAVLFGLWVAGIQTLGTTIDIRPCDAASLQEHMDYYRSVENGSVSVSSEQLFNNEAPFLSDDPADYRDVYIRADVKNYSCFKKSISEARLFISPAEQTGVIMTNGSPVTTWVDAFSEENGVYVAHIMYYCGDKADDEVERELRSIRFEWMSNALGEADLQDARLQQFA